MAYLTKSEVNERDEYITERIKEGANNVEIAQELGVSRERVRIIRNRLLKGAEYGIEQN